MRTSRLLLHKNSTQVRSVCDPLLRPCRRECGGCLLPQNTSSIRLLHLQSERRVQLRASSLQISPRCGIRWCGSHPNVDVTRDPLWVLRQVLSPAACVTVRWSGFSWKKQHISHVCGCRTENLPVVEILSAHSNYLSSIHQTLPSVLPAFIGSFYVRFWL